MSMGIEAFGMRQHKGKWVPVLQRFEGPDACKECRGFGTYGNPLAGAVYTCKKCDGEGRVGPKAWIKRDTVELDEPLEEQPQSYREVPKKKPQVGPHTFIQRVAAWAKVKFDEMDMCVCTAVLLCFAAGILLAIGMLLA